MNVIDAFALEPANLPMPKLPIVPGLKALCGEQVLVKPLPPPRQRRSGLWIPDTAEQNKQSYEGALNGRVFEGIVHACGPGKRDEQGRLVPVDVVPGDHVRFYFFSDYYLRWPTPEYLILPASSIQAIVTPDGIVPLGNRVLVERMELVDKSKILAPEISKKTTLMGRVLSVGNGDLFPTAVLVGQKILFNAYSGTAIEWENKDLLILKEPEVIGIVED